MSAFSLAGQTSTQLLHPVQSSGEIWMRNYTPSCRPIPVSIRCPMQPPRSRSQERTDHSVRTNVRALVALDTLIDLPFGDIDGDAALLPCSGSVLPRTIFTSVECRHGQQISLEGIDRIDDVAHELRTSHIHAVIGRFQLDIRPLGRDFDLHDCVTARIDGRIVHIDDVLALLAVALIDRFLHLLDGLLERNHVRDF